LTDHSSRTKLANDTWNPKRINNPKYMEAKHIYNATYRKKTRAGKKPRTTENNPRTGEKPRTTEKNPRTGENPRPAARPSEKKQAMNFEQNI
jgi:hypothetical protein